MLEKIYFTSVIACMLSIYAVDEGVIAPAIVGGVFSLCFVCGICRAIKERRNSVCG